MSEPSLPADSALELRALLRRHEVSSRELAENALARAKAKSELGVFVSLGPELAIADATAADRRIATTPPTERHALPPLLGLPTAHKDLIDVQGFVTTHGSAAVPHTLAEFDDPLAASARSAGAICIGKTQVPEFGIAGYSENLVAEPARNPFDLDRTAGGSSGGSAAAVAAGMVPVAIGSDAGGSIRIPAAACGLIGLKPGRGVVPADRTKQQGPPVPLAQTAKPIPLTPPVMAVSGPLSRTVQDAALLFDAMLGAVEEPALKAVRRASDLQGLRIGVSLASPFESQLPIHFDQAALDQLARACQLLESAGHAVEQADFDYGVDYPEAFTTVWTQALTRIPFESDAESRLGRLATWFLHRARSTTEPQLHDAIERLNRFAASAERQWSQYDAVLTPALAHAAPLIGEFWRSTPEYDYRLQCEWAPQTSMVNVVGAPAIVVPMGLDAEGMPRGVQLIGRTGSEIQLLQLAAQLHGE